MHTDLCGALKAIGLVYGRAVFEPGQSGLHLYHSHHADRCGEYKLINNSTLVLVGLCVLQKQESWELGVSTPLQLEFCVRFRFGHADEVT